MQEEFQYSLSRLEATAIRLSPYVRKTPLVPSSSSPGTWLKAENLQATGSFKVRPAFAELLALSEAERKKGVVVSSSGNFAQGAAYASSLLDIDLKVVMMRSSSSFKVARTQHLGAEVVFCEDRFEARAETVSAIAQEEGRHIIHSYDDPAAVLGNSTLGREIASQARDIQHVVVPISGGGLITGTAAGLRAYGRQWRVWGVQPEGSNATYLSFQRGERVGIEKARTIADGLIVTKPGSVTFPLLRKWVDDVVVVSDDAIREATRRCWLEDKLVVEPSGAASLAAVLEGKVPRAAVCVLSGGNFDPQILPSILQLDR